MKITIHIKETLTQLAQMAAQLGVAPIDNRLTIPESMGSGTCAFFSLPFEIQLHHYQYCLKRQIEVESHNSVQEGMYMVNINLSDGLLDKDIGPTQYWLSREGKRGVLFYSPGNNSTGKNEIDVPYEVLFFSIPQSTMKEFLKRSLIEEVHVSDPFCRYAEIEDETAEELSQLLKSHTDQNFFTKQGKLLEILGLILQRFLGEEWKDKKSGLKMRDVETLLQVKSILYRHIFGSPPSIKELAQQSHMSPTKLKTDFKSLFGTSIYQYYLRIKLNVAHELLKNKEGTIGEIGYRLGYSNISQFSAQFKKQFGTSPSQIKG